MAGTLRRRAPQILAALVVGLIAGTLGVVLLADRSLDRRAAESREDRERSERRIAASVDEFAGAVVAARQPRLTDDRLREIAEERRLVLRETSRSPELVLTVEGADAVGVLFGVDNVRVCHRLEFRDLGTPSAGYARTPLPSCPTVPPAPPSPS